MAARRACSRALLVASAAAPRRTPSLGFLGAKQQLWQQVSGSAARNFVSLTSAPTHSQSLLPAAAAAAIAAAVAAGAVGASVVNAGEMERTYIMIKPDGVQRGLISDIIERFERKGYKLVGIKMVHPTKAFAEKHYDDLRGRPFFNGLTDFLSSGPVVAMVWEGPGVIAYGRKLIGATNPQASEPGTIRGDLAIIVGRNIIHGSDGPETAKNEISLWFKPYELMNYPLDSHKWVYEK